METGSSKLSLERAGATGHNMRYLTIGTVALTVLLIGTYLYFLI